MGIFLKTVSGPMAGKEFYFCEPDILLFGRHNDCHCCLPDDTQISRHHFMFEANPPDCQIKDLGSLNGTWVNGIKYGGRDTREPAAVDEAVKNAKPIGLKDGDEIRVGQTVIKVVIIKEESDGMLENNMLYSDNAMLDRLLGDLFGNASNGQTDMPGIPGYLFIRELGRGGFGKVYLVERDSDRKKLALKIMLANRKEVGEKEIEKFQREMDNCIRLKHENIVRFEGQDYNNGMFYFTMEFCAGGSLQKLMEERSGKLDVKQAGPYMLQILEGLEYIHANGFVHRDLKPDNILFDANRRSVKIADLGLAKNFEKAGLSGFTATGTYAGTPYFMPKEQITNYRDVKPCSDVFAIGATFYKMLSGEYVYNFSAKKDPLLVILKGDVVPLGNRRSGLPEAISGVIDKAVSVEPANRYKDAGEMRKDFEKAWEDYRRK